MKRGKRKRMADKKIEFILFKGGKEGTIEGILGFCKDGGGKLSQRAYQRIAINI